MASSILSTMKTTPANNAGLISQFIDFKKKLDASGQNPEALLNSLITSGKINNAQLEQAQKLARMFSNILPK